jgi:hypothetical protein
LTLKLGTLGTLHPFSKGFLLFLGYFKETKCRLKQNIQASKTLKLFGTDLPNQSRIYLILVNDYCVTMGIFFSAWHVENSTAYFLPHRPGVIWLLTGKFILSALQCFFVPVLIGSISFPPSLLFKILKPCPEI